MGPREDGVQAKRRPALQQLHALAVRHWDTVCVGRVAMLPELGVDSHDPMRAQLVRGPMKPNVALPC
jgi:hypothetical protein